MAEHGEEALAAVVDQENFDLILMDIQVRLFSLILPLLLPSSCSTSSGRTSCGLPLPSSPSSPAQMPIMDGIAATQELRRRGCTVPILGLTANADDETRIEAMSAGTLSKTVKLTCCVPRV